MLRGVWVPLQALRAVPWLPVRCPRRCDVVVVTGHRGPEAAWQAKVYDLATLYGWDTYHTHDSRRSEKGWVDLVLAKQTRVLFVELKGPGRYPTPDQRRWLANLHAAGVEVTVWWPHDLPAAIRTLGPRAERLVLPVRYRTEETKKPRG